MRIIKFVLFLYFITFFVQQTKAQHLIFQDVFQGGVSYAGFSTGTAYTGNYIGHFDTYIEPGSSIYKVFFIYYSHRKPQNSILVHLNGSPIELNDNVNSFDYFITNQFWQESLGVTNFLDITSIYSPLQPNQIDIPSQTLNNIASYFGNFSILILYKNPALNTVNVSLFFNDQDLNSQTNSYSASLNPVLTNSSIGFSINSDIIGLGNTIDGTNVYVNNNLLGVIGGADGVNQNTDLGTRGHFYYQDSQLYGLDDDIPDGDMMNSDALADISNYFIQNQPLNWKMEWANHVAPENIYNSFQLAYSTPCQPQNVTVSNDTIICPNVPLQLHATGGSPNSHSTSGYEWLPQENLSCYDCADPVFTGDSSQLYTVRIWGSDSCSVVRPVMVRVRPKPTFSNLSLTPSECGGANGTVSVVSFSGVAYSLDSLSWQASTGSAYQFQNLAPGNYTVFVTDTSGCIGDSSVFIAEQLTVNAAFTATPTAGAIPLQVNLSNQSTNYTNLEWFIAGASQGNALSNYTVNQSGTVEITLVAWQNDPTCADTAQISILAFDSLIISIPNIITPNNDGTNDVFSISSNLPIDVEYFITNRWGNTVASGLLTNQQGEITLWNGVSTTSLTNQNPTEGVYFYVLQFSSPQNNIQKQLEALGSEQHGMVTVVR